MRPSYLPFTFRAALAGVLLLVGFACSAQHLWPAYVVMHSGDSIRGAIRLTSPHQQQSRIKFVPMAATKRLVLKPEEVRAYGYIKGTDTLRYVSCSFPLGTVSSYTKLVNGKPQVVVGMANLVMRVFLRQLVAGPVQLYERNVLNGSRGASIGRRELLLARPGQPLVNTYWWNFPKNAASFFGDNTALATDLEHGHYRPRDLPTIVQRYNREQASAALPRH